jgi:hypothetical protein
LRRGPCWISKGSTARGRLDLQTGGGWWNPHTHTGARRRFGWGARRRSDWVPGGVQLNRLETERCHPEAIDRGVTRRRSLKVSPEGDRYWVQSGGWFSSRIDHSSRVWCRSLAVARGRFDWVARGRSTEAFRIVQSRLEAYRSVSQDRSVQELAVTGFGNQLTGKCSMQQHLALCSRTM